MEFFFDLLGRYSDEIVVGVFGGLAGGFLAEVVSYLSGWYEVRKNRSADFHIAATMFTPIDLTNPLHAEYREAAQSGKTHVQELLWLGEEKPLKEFLHNRFVLREVRDAMHKARNEGLLLGKITPDAQRPLLKRIVGYHNCIPNNDIVRIYKQYAGSDAQGRVYGISPPVHEHYPGSIHRRVLRAMFIPSRVLDEGLPPKDKVHFIKETHAHRYDTIMTLTQMYRDNPALFADCRAYF